MWHDAADDDVVVDDVVAEAEFDNVSMNQMFASVQLKWR